MLNDFYKVLIDTLRSNSEYVSNDNSLLKNKIYESAMMMDENLIKLLFENETIRSKLFKKVGKTYIFDKVEFSWLINNKEFLPDSYTKFANKIGLTSNGQYFSKNNDVVLNFPFKDCILEGGQTKEDQKRNERFYNEIIASDEITKMLSPKVFTNMTLYNKNGSKKIDHITDNDNLLIKGNNLLSISSLLPRYEGKIKLIYIDPPYNTGSDTFSYNDSFSRSSWLTFMKNRLEIAKRLLSKDGAIYVQLDYHQVHYCKVLMDEIFGEDNFQREIIWRIGWLSGYKTKDKNWIRNHDTILFYSKNNLEMKKSFNKYYLYNIDFKEYIDEKTLINKLKEYGIDKNKSKSIANFINHENRPKKYPIEDIWNGNEYDDLNSIAIMSFSGETVSKMLNKNDAVKGQKSEKLLERIIKAHTKDGDIVLDFFGGTGTTAATAMKMNRKFIICEQLDKHISICKRRLEKVIQGEEVGISKKYNWSGGGSFIYCEMKELGNKYINKINNCSSSKELISIWNELKKSTFVNFRIDIDEFDNNINQFEKLDLPTQKEILIGTVDKNQLFVNYCDIDDKEYSISNDEKKFNKEFYEGE